MTAVECAFAGAAFLDTNAGHLIALGGAPDHLRQLLETGADLEQEYVRLFLNPAGSPCPPWQSAHEGEHKLMGDAHVSALHWYSRYSASPRLDTEPADHIGLLLMFYAQLAAAGAGEDELRSFSARHLYWVPEFLRSVAQESRVPFYTELARWAYEDGSWRFQKPGRGTIAHPGGVGAI